MNALSYRPWHYSRQLLMGICCCMSLGLVTTSLAHANPESLKRELAVASPQTVLERKTINTVPAAPTGLNIYVTDLANLLRPEELSALKDQLGGLDKAGYGQVVVLTLPDTDRELSEFAPEIFNSWGIGHKGKDNGVLILANATRITQNLSGNRIFIATGYGVEDRIPDAVAGRILDNVALPAFESGNYSGGIASTATAVAGILSGDEAYESLSQTQDEEELPLGSAIILGIFFLWLLLRYGFGLPISFGGGGYSSSGSSHDFGGGFGGGDSGGGGAGR